METLTVSRNLLASQAFLALFFVITLPAMGNEGILFAVIVTVDTSFVTKDFSYESRGNRAKSIDFARRQELTTD